MGGWQLSPSVQQAGGRSTCAVEEVQSCVCSCRTIRFKLKSSDPGLIVLIQVLLLLISFPEQLAPIKNRVVSALLVPCPFCCTCAVCFASPAVPKLLLLVPNSFSLRHNLHGGRTPVHACTHARIHTCTHTCTRTRPRPSKIIHASGHASIHKRKRGEDANGSL